LSLVVIVYKIIYDNLIINIIILITRKNKGN